MKPYIPRNHHRPDLVSKMAGRWIAGLLVTALLGLGAVQAQTIGTDKPSYATGEDIIITFQGPGNVKDWVGVYPEGTPPGDATSTWWLYVDGTQDGITGVASGSFTITGGLGVGGNWVAYLFENDGYVQLATAPFEVISSGPQPRVVSRHSQYLPEEEIEISWSNGPGNALDWIGIYPADEAPEDGNYVLWAYVDGTQDGSVGLRQGSITFPAGSLEVGEYMAYFLLDNGYIPLAEVSFAAINPVDDVLVRTDAATYLPNQPITVFFSNGWETPKDWIGIYRVGDDPAVANSVLWIYTDGTTTGEAGVLDGSVLFADGLSETGDFVAYFFLNDTYEVWGREAFSVSESGLTPQLLSIQPSDGSDNNPPIVAFAASITNGVAGVDPSTVQLTLDGTVVAATTDEQAGWITVTYTNAAFFASGSGHTFELSYSDDAEPANPYTHTVAFSVGQYRNIVLPEPIYFEDFDSTAEAQLPAGWSELSYTETVNTELDLVNLDSLSYATWIVVEAERFANPMVGYSDPDYSVDYQQVLSVNPLNVIDGAMFLEPLASGRFVFGNSGYRQGLSQVLYLFTPDYDLSGHTDVHVSYHSVWEQNQDSIGAVEYSVDGGQSWLPVVYMLEEPDVVRDTEENIDAVATFTQEHDDVARYVDPDTLQTVGGTYGTFIATPISQDLAPFISPRIDDDAVGSKRIELFRLPEADDQSQVRFRFAHAGVDSWYFGLDNFGLYSIPEVVEGPTLTISADGSSLTISWPAEATGFVLEEKGDLSQPDWTTVDVGGGNSYPVPPATGPRFYRLRQ